MTDLGKSVLSAEPGVPAAPSVEWQPIEAAPKDGTPILSWDGNVMAVLVYCGCERQWQLVEDVDYSAHPESPIEWAGATHWMPLPPPPDAPDAPGGPQLGRPLRSRHEAALDIAVKALQKIAYGPLTESGNLMLTASREFEKLAKLVPEVVWSC